MLHTRSMPGAMRRTAAIVATTATTIALGGVAALATTAPASAVPTSYSGAISVIDADGNNLGCLQANGPFVNVTTDPSAVLQATISAGTGQQLTLGDGHVLGADAYHTPLSLPDAYGYAILDPQRAPDDTEETETAIWSIDSATGALTPTWTYDDGSTGALTTFNDSWGDTSGSPTTCRPSSRSTRPRTRPPYSSSWSRPRVAPPRRRSSSPRRHPHPRIPARPTRRRRRAAARATR